MQGPNGTQSSETPFVSSPAPANESAEQQEGKQEPSANAIIKLTEEVQMQFFHTPGNEPFARFYVNDHWENHALKGATFREFLCAMCYRKKRFIPNIKVLAEVTNVLSGRALYENPERQIYVRTAEHDGAIYVDLGSKSWEVVRITGEGWEVVSDAPLKFVRAPGMLPLPLPEHAGKLEDLRSILNLHEEDDWKLAVGWLIAALRPKGPFPLLVVQGTHGSAKSTAARLLRTLVDPNEAPLRSEPDSRRDLAISARNSWCLGFGNLSSVRPWLSDALCRLSTGGGFSTRALYTDGEEKIFDGTRPVLLTGIDIGIEREDLMDRCIFLSLPPIDEDGRVTEAEVSKRFSASCPSALGCLFDAVVCALRRLPDVRLARPPRMADFATWVCAAEPALGWPEGSFLNAYQRNRAESNSLALETSSLFRPIIRLLEDGPWEGTATELMSAVRNLQLTGMALEDVGPVPEKLHAFSQAFHRLAPNLRQAGVNVKFGRTAGRDSKRTITIERSGDAATS